MYNSQIVCRIGSLATTASSVTRSVELSRPTLSWACVYADRSLRSYPDPTPRIVTSLTQGPRSSLMKIHIDGDSAPPTMDHSSVAVSMCVGLLARLDDLRDVRRDPIFDVLFHAEATLTRYVFGGCADGFQDVDRPRPRISVNFGARRWLFELLCSYYGFRFIIIIRGSENSSTCLCCDLGTALHWVVWRTRSPCHSRWAYPVDWRLKHPSWTIGWLWCRPVLVVRCLAHCVTSAILTTPWQWIVWCRCVALRRDDVIIIEWRHRRRSFWSQMLRPSERYGSLDRVQSIRWRQADLGRSWLTTHFVNSCCSSDVATWSTRVLVHSGCGWNRANIPRQRDHKNCWWNDSNADCPFKCHPLDPWFGADCRVAKRVVRLLERAVRRTEPADVAAATITWTAARRRECRDMLQKKREIFWKEKLDAERYCFRIRLYSQLVTIIALAYKANCLVMAPRKPIYTLQLTDCATLSNNKMFYAR